MLFSPLLQTVSGLKHAFSTRHAGKSAAPLDSFNLGRHQASAESKADALVNRARLCQVLGMDASRLQVPGQVHSSNVAWIEDCQDLAQVDAVATATANTPILLSYADCVPIIIACPVKRAVAVIHAGWRGTTGSIAAQAVKTLVKNCGSKPQNLLAAIGPAIGSCCYPTGAEVAEQLLSTVQDGQDLIRWKDNQPHPELASINALQLLQSGVENIDTCNLCTCCNKHLFFSHRAFNGQTGRQGAIACITN